MKIEVAGTVIEDPVDAIAAWIVENERAVRNYDLREQEDPNTITAQDVLSTQYTKLRVDSMELQHFVDRSRKAPWDNVPLGARLQDADPLEEDGLYDRAEEFYKAFHKGRRRGMTSGKIHRVLHLKRQALFPLLDGRVHDLFEGPAKEASLRLRDEGRRGRRGKLYWVAIRDDLLAADDAWDEVRAALGEMDEPASLGAQLTDVRLHDILCWELVRRR